jgi:hypothetical protein
MVVLGVEEYGIAVEVVRVKVVSVSGLVEEEEEKEEEEGEEDDVQKDKGKSTLLPGTIAYRQPISIILHTEND